MNKWRLLVIIFLFAQLYLPAFSQQAIITRIKAVNPATKEKEFFPLIQIPGNKTATKKINKLIREENLYLDSTVFKKSIFEAAWNKDNLNNPGWEYDSFNYTVFSNTDKYICLLISFVGGKQLLTQEAYYLFDNVSGDKVNYKQVINIEGQSWIVDTMASIQKRRVEKLLPALLDSLKIPFVPKDAEDSIEGNYFQKEYDMYKACIESKIPSYSSDNIEYLDMYIKNDTLFAKGLSCLWSPYSLAYDELGEVEFSISIKSIDKLLTPYGRKLLLVLKKE
ncbi:MAG: hypothetical protein K2X37_12740 [Chitinophagaceae bacterium]|nr:hypothetical protein [Chitinophagaceae bacterium]